MNYPYKCKCGKKGVAMITIKRYEEEGLLCECGEQAKRTYENVAPMLGGDDRQYKGKH